MISEVSFSGLDDWLESPVPMVPNRNAYFETNDPRIDAVVAEVEHAMSACGAFGPNVKITHDEWSMVNAEDGKLCVRLPGLSAQFCTKDEVATLVKRWAEIGRKLCDVRDDLLEMREAFHKEPATT